METNKTEATTTEKTLTMENINIKTYVVVRNGVRVSDREYSDPNDPAARSEKEFWTKVAKKSHGEPVEIVIYDSRKHRVW